MILMILDMAATSLWLAWCAAGMACRSADLAKKICAELMPVVWIAPVLQYIAESIHHPFSAMRAGWAGFSLVVWLFIRRSHNHDDDRWKRRKKKLASKVAQVGGKLTVVPAEAGAR